MNKKFKKYKKAAYYLIKYLLKYCRQTQEVSYSKDFQ